ncbi:MAG TPA: serine hydrolase [Aquabacterium sp.]|uniref:serine hydrolase domain-containing protein n=1 Tax=Aquabacterium sp. TaxID=1872578 RepID=UPI002E30FCAB|nr:serine hydrolase [Aquabacterium sp.]HEX5374336.1 serine hydrolase [Aquabacterium sp.]
MKMTFRPLHALALTAAAATTPLVVNAQTLPPSLFLPEVVLPRADIPASTQAVTLSKARSPKDITQVTYSFNGQARTFNQFLSQAKVKSFMVLKNGQIVHEYHRFPNTRTTLHQSWSIGKQVLSTLVGIALEDGAIQSINDRMDRYDPRLAANGFAGVTFKQALQMSSGVKYDEEADRYSLFFDVIGDFYSFGRSGSTLTEKALGSALTPAFTPGSAYQYASINSEAIKLALEKAVGMRYQDYLATKLWQPMGMPDKAKVLIDREKTAFTFCCLYATTRDYAMFGQMYAQAGWFNGRQIVPRDYVRQATTFAGDPSNWRATDVPRKDGSTIRGFGYHWWPLEGEREDFTAAGVYGQSIHVLPKQNTVVVRLSNDYDNVEASAHEAVILGRAIADYLE